MKNWITAIEASRETGIPDRTIRRYLAIHGNRIKHKKDGRFFLISASALPLLSEIRNYYDSGWTGEQVEEALTEQGLPAIVTLSDDGHPVTAMEALRGVAKAMTIMAKEQERLKSEILELRQELAATQEREINRDKRLMIEIRRILYEKGKPRRWWWPFS